MKRFAILLFFLFATAASVKAQVSPISGVGVLQLLDNTGAPATAGCYYFYTAGTSQQQATFTDSTGLTQNTNPLCLGQGARANGVWLTSSAQYKIVACLANDGPFCNGPDVLWSQDFLPASSGGGGGAASCSSGCSGFFISGTASPATSGVLRCASGDQCIAFRNQAGSGNLILNKDSSDILTWQGGDEKFSEINCPATSPSGFGLVCADVTAHRIKIGGSGATMQQAVVAGVDLSNTDGVTALHFGATQETLSSTAPTTGQFLQFNGTNIVGATPNNFESTLTWGAVSVTIGTPACTETLVNSGGCVETFFVNAHTLIRLTYTLVVSPAGCSTSPVIGLRDITAGSNVSTLTVANGASTGFVDSGPLSAAMTAGHKFGLWFITPSVGCGTNAQAGGLTAVFQ